MPPRLRDIRQIATPALSRKRVSTKDPDDLYVFRVASLRNVAMTPPYFHDGSVETLPEAVKVMARVQLGVTLEDADIRDIVAFLQSLTGELPANFVTAPVLPSGTVVPAE